MTTQTKSHERLHRVVVRFAGDSGDGMQLTGERFTAETAEVGNDLATLPDYPAEIRAPAGTIPGVSSFQLHFSDEDVLTPGDAPDVLVAMNAAALKKNVGDVKVGGTLIVNEDGFTAPNLKKAGYASNPLDDDSLGHFQVYRLPLTELTTRAVEDLVESKEISNKDAARAKNMFALGLISWMFSRPIDSTLAWIDRKFARDQVIAEANVRALKAGHHFGETTEMFGHAYEVKPAKLPPGRYRNISGNAALSYGLIAASVRSGLPLFYGSYPITPASDILHELARHRRFGVRTFQAEDEIAAVGAALGASFGGALGVTASSGPGIALKAETIGLAVAVELPLVIIDVQRGGPSTGLPTKTEQADLLQVMFGRNGESPIPVVAAQSPGDCFYAALEAVRIALKHRTPVMLLSDGYLANGAEPWRLPNLDDVPPLDAAFATEPNGPEGQFLPFLRDPETLARPWAVPGTPGLEHRIGGLEKADVTGNISYEPDNHHRMTELRQAKVDRIAVDIPQAELDSDDGSRLLVVSWGSTYGPVKAAIQAVRARGERVAHTHLRHLNPFPSNLGEILGSYERVLVPEVNMGQLRLLLRARYLVDAVGYNRMLGQPFRTSELETAILEQLRTEAVQVSANGRRRLRAVKEARR
ncbi:MAG: 2-oxoacid:acceptor oxidoreductase subunit alpha [Actinomycetota bacterium]|nr:2-oxoacid:acceptor oxidoreductase subunit alpha [Actinomycetota bacterium]